jgi:hypothetical protein
MFQQWIKFEHAGSKVKAALWAKSALTVSQVF